MIMKSILVPIDFSENADRALAAAKIMADKQITRLFVLHAYQAYNADLTVMPEGGGMASSGMMNMWTDLENEFKERLKEYVDALTADGYLATAVWSAGSVSFAIEEAINEHNPELIVMGRTGSGGFLDKLIGSSATKIALNAPCPVMIIPPQVTPKSFKNVVYATQFEYEENDILRKVLTLVNHLGGHLTLLKIDADTQPDIQPDHQYIKQIQNEFAIHDEDIVIRKNRYVLNGIEAYCDETNVDLLIMSARERSFIEKFLINPSVTKKLVIHTHVPLLVFHLK